MCSRREAVILVTVLVALAGHIAPAPADNETPPPTDTTGPPPADPVLLGAGDIANCADRTGAMATAAVLDRTPGTVFTLGDNVYVDGTPDEFAQCYAPDWGRHKARTAFAVAGNHDAEGTLRPPNDMAPRWLAAAPGGDTRDALASAFDTAMGSAGPTGGRVATATEPGARIGVLLALRPGP